MEANKNILITGGLGNHVAFNLATSFSANVVFPDPGSHIIRIFLFIFF
jgi:hypothetical protein